MEIRLGIITKDSIEEQINNSKIISPEIYAQYHDSVVELENFYKINKLFEIVLKNFEEFNSFFRESVNHLAQKMTTPIGVERKDGDDILININRYVLNYLSSIRTFLDHSETTINRKFGADSEQFKEFKITLSSYFDNSFAYRFLYKLRDYTQHCDLPFENISLSFHFLGNNQINIGIGVSLNAQRLLSNFDGWGRVKKDLQTNSSTLDFNSLIIEETRIIKEISKRIISLNKNEIESSTKFITDLTAPYKINDQKVCLFKNIERGNENIISYAMEQIPFELIDFFTRLQ